MENFNNFKKQDQEMNKTGQAKTGQEKTVAHKVGDAIEQLGDKLEHSGLKKVGDAIEKLGDKVEHLGEGDKKQKTA